MKLSRRLRDPAGPIAAFCMSVLGAAMLTAAFQPLNQWWIVPIGVGLQLWALRGRSKRAAATIGFASGLVFFLLHIQWITVYLGPVPWLALSAFMALWWGIGALVIRLVWAYTEGWRSQWSRLIGISTLLGAVWMTRETLSATIPWGGFSWGRLAFSQASSPLGDTVSWTGASGLTFLLASASALGVLLVAGRGELIRRRITIAAAVAVGLVAIPAFPVTYSGEFRVGAVQGDSEAGLLSPYTPGEIITEHVDASAALAGEDMDLLVWPENAGETNPQSDPVRTQQLNSVQDSVDAPILLGAVLDDGTDAYNSAILWDAGIVAEYHKRHPVPFAEYLPSRAFFGPVLDALGFLDLIPRDYSIDDNANALTIDGVHAGIAICFDIIDDALVREMVLDHDAEIIIAPTNNADFGEGSAENVQQLAIAQLRAMESGRALVNISTVGTSAMVLPDGSIVQSLPQYSPGVMLETLPTSNTVTPAIAFGLAIEIVIMIAALLSVATLGVIAMKERRRIRA